MLFFFFFFHSPIQLVTCGLLEKKGELTDKPTLSFTQQRKNTAPTKGKLGKTESRESIVVHESTPTPEPEIEVEVEVEQSSPEIAKEGRGEKRGLNVKSREWAGVYADAKVAMGNMEPSECQSCSLEWPSLSLCFIQPATSEKKKHMESRRGRES